jgi:hypothetical protein
MPDTAAADMHANTIKCTFEDRTGKSTKSDAAAAHHEVG